MRILILAPHTDDGEFGCGGSIARFVAEGHGVHYVAFSSAEKSIAAEFTQWCKVCAVQTGKAARYTPGVVLRISGPGHRRGVPESGESPERSRGPSPALRGGPPARDVHPQAATGHPDVSGPSFLARHAGSVAASLDEDGPLVALCSRHSPALGASRPPREHQLGARQQRGRLERPGRLGCPHYVSSTARLWASGSHNCTNHLRYDVASNPLGTPAHCDTVGCLPAVRHACRGIPSALDTIGRRTAHPGSTGRWQKTVWLPGRICPLAEHAITEMLRLARQIPPVGPTTLGLLWRPSVRFPEPSLRQARTFQC